ncbi:GNAT family N-acetyltransferase [Kiloniella sp.]|uniref:GNAT family N-acetyltransferase n=1 Tax=Kiloniella sp. TaxID=1938587 RepID=UPI003B027DAA
MSKISTDTPITIRQFVQSDQAMVQDLFIRTNRELSPPDMIDAFETYIQRSLVEEIDQLEEYYNQRNGMFFVAKKFNEIAGMFGIETVESKVMELRRMYVNQSYRGQGLGHIFLNYAENYCRSNGAVQLILSTSEIQIAALSLYKKSGYTITGEEVADSMSNKTVGGQLRRYYFKKNL